MPKTAQLTFAAQVSKIKYIIKRLLKTLPVSLTKNHRYDRQTEAIIRQQLGNQSNCVDVGTHRGEIFDLFLKYAPGGRHFGFEPIPELFRGLEKKYGGDPRCSIFQVALSDKTNLSSFNYVITNPAYSGIRKRRYDRKNEKDTVIQVQTDLLDNLVPAGLPIHFIKIDVEGGELDVLRGARRILSADHPLVVFECGLGGSDVYGTTPQKIFFFFRDLGYQISLLGSFLKRRPPLSLEDFILQFERNENYYFVAHTQE